MPSDPYAHTIAALTSLGSLRVWSLMVTIFGDLAQEDGTSIQGPTLSAILSEMNIRPEAVRVALHRLRNDGWITSTKTGRTSNHQLTALGRSESAKASARIYADPDSTATGWRVIVLPDATNINARRLAKLGFLPLMPRTFIGDAAATPPPGALVLQGPEIPDWLPEQFEPQDLARDYAALSDALEAATSSLPAAAELTALQTAVLRCMIVHCWRRIVLKHPNLPRALFTPNWAGHSCHQMVSELLRSYPRPSLTQIAAP